MHLPVLALPGALPLQSDPAGQAVAAQVFGMRANWWHPGSAFAIAQLGYTPANKAGESFTGKIGYATGASIGGAVTQATSKTTGVTLNTVTGQITLNAAALAANTTVSFTLTNSTIAADDLIIAHRKSGGTAGAYQVWCDSVSAGSCVICVRNTTVGPLSEAVVLQFTVIKGAIN
ncbi:MAG: hypothetical protein ACM3WS_07645 [Bacillota bacterium]